MADATGRRCVICSQFIERGQSIETRGSGVAHTTCLGARKPGARLEPPPPGAFKNERTAGGLPICSVCKRAIALSEPASRSGDYMVHVECLAAARREGVG